MHNLVVAVFSKEMWKENLDNFLEFFFHSVIVCSILPHISFIFAFQKFLSKSVVMGGNEKQ